MTDENLYIQAERMLTEYVEQNKLRKSPERYAILKHIYACDSRFTAEQLHSEINSTYRVSLATIYNTLDFFVKSRLVVRYSFGPKAVEYERALGAEAKHFLICTKCNKVTEFSEKHFKAYIGAKNFRNFQMGSYSLYISGQCKRCRKLK